MRIALTVNPNSGKTTMFNALTGRNEKVGNWAGVTVDKKVFFVTESFGSKIRLLQAIAMSFLIRSNNLRTAIRLS